MTTIQTDQFRITDISDWFAAAFPSVAALADGRFAVSFYIGGASILPAGFGDDDGMSGVQFVGVDGALLGDPFRTNFETDGIQWFQQIAPSTDGGFVYAFQDEGSDSDVYAGRFDAAGTRVGAEVKLNDLNDTKHQIRPDIVALADGGFFATWNQDETHDETHARIYNADGSPRTASFPVFPKQNHTQDYASIVQLKGGNVAIVNYAREIALFSPQGEALGAIGSISGPRTGFRFPEAVALEGGGFVVVWDDSSRLDGDDSGRGVHGRMFDASGVPTGDVFLVNTTTAGSQIVPKVAALPGGGFVVVWIDQLSSGGLIQYSNVMLQAFDAAGDRIGVETQVNDPVDPGELGNGRAQVSVASNGDGTVLVSWNESFVPGSDKQAIGGVYGRILSIEEPVIVDDRFTEGPDVVSIGIGETVDALGGDDVVTGAAGAETILGGEGADTLIGAAGNDVLDAGGTREGAANFLLGGPGNDTYIVRNATDVVDEGFLFPEHAGGAVDFDTIISHAEFWWDFYHVGERHVIAEDNPHELSAMVGSLFGSEMVGNSKDNIIYTVGGDNVVRPGDGIDWIALGTVDGFRGMDTLVLEKPSGALPSWAVVYGFMPGEDRVDVSGLDVDGFAAIQAAGHDDGAGNSYYLLDGGTNILFLVGLEKAELSAADFIV